MSDLIYIYDNEGNKSGRFRYNKLIADCSAYNLGDFTCYVRDYKLFAKTAMAYVLSRTVHKVEKVPTKFFGMNAIEDEVASNKYIFTNNDRYFEDSGYLGYHVVEMLKDLGAVEQINTTAGWTGELSYQIRCYTLPKSIRLWKHWPKELRFSARNAVSTRPKPKVFPECLIKTPTDW